MSVISVEQLKFKYQNAKKNAVDGVSFCITSPKSVNSAYVINLASVALLA